jgi:cell division protein FtsB
MTEKDDFIPKNEQTEEESSLLANSEDKEENPFLRLDPKRYSSLGKKALKVALFIVGLLLLYFFLGGETGFIRYMRYKLLERKLRNDIEYEKKRHDSLLFELEKLETDSSYIEYIARTKLGMVRENEKIIRFRTVSKDSAVTVSYDSTSPSNPEQITDTVKSDIEKPTRPVRKLK